MAPSPTRASFNETTPLLNGDAAGADNGVGRRKEVIRDRTFGSKSSGFSLWGLQRRRSTRQNVLGDNDIESSRQEIEDNNASHFYFDTSAAGRWWEIFDLLLNVSFVALYIYNTSYRTREHPDERIPMRNHELDFLLAILILGQWFPRFWLSLDPATMTSIFAFLTIISTISIPILEAASWGLEDRKAKSIHLSETISITAFVHMVERTQHQQPGFWDVYYWIFVTSSSGLSTKIVPDDVLSRIVVLYLHGYKPHTKRDHVVVVGELEIHSVKDFLREFFCEDHGPSTMSTRVVMLNPEEPSEALKGLLVDPLYANRVTYVKGSTMNSHDLSKTKLENARACFILSANYADRVTSELGIIAQNCIASGFATLVNILITSIPEPSIRSFRRSYNVKKGGAWVKEYVQGLSMEIYSVTMSRCFRGLTFKAAAERIFLRHNSILFAIASAEKDLNDDKHFFHDSILMNPSDYVMQGGEQAYMIAMDAFTAEKVAGDADWLLRLIVKERLNGKRTGSLKTQMTRTSLVWSRSGRKNSDSVDDDNEENGGSTSTAPVRPDEVSSGRASPIKEAAIPEHIPIRSTSLSTLKVDVNASPLKTTNETLSPVEAEATPESPQKNRSDLVFMGVKGEGYNVDVNSSQNLEMALAPAPQPKADISEKLPESFLENHLTPVPAELMTPSPIMTPKPSDLCDHLLICSLNTDGFPSNLAFLLAPVRLRYPEMGIVILAPVDPDDEERDRLLAYSLVHIVHGSALSRNRLEEMRCRAWFIKPAVGFLNIESIAKSDVFITVEFLHASNMKLMGSWDEYYSKIDVYGHSILPAFASGHVFSKSMLNTLLVQTYYNPHLLVILKHLIFSYKAYHPNAVRHGSTSSIWGDNPVSPESPDITEHGQVFKLKIPKKYIGQKYALLFVRAMRDHSALCIALYRYEEVKGNPVRLCVFEPGTGNEDPEGGCRIFVGKRGACFVIERLA
ncbi:hypothetical protein BC829DRAFT_440747 [Chytridium lagenaria]|nr:hypothetical protein BC829DRAFT_440747 [Chytridium lagenaria]